MKKFFNKTRIILYGILISQLTYYYLPLTYIHPETREMYDMYKTFLESNCVAGKDYKEPGQNFIYFKNIPEENIVGQNLHSKLRSSIELDPEYWHKYSEDSKYVLMFHELTHGYFLEPDHTDDENYFMYESLNPGITKFDLYKQFHEYLDKKCRKNL